MKKLPNFLSKINSNTIAESSQSSSPWPWPAYCQQPRTLSFRNNGDNIFKTLNSVFNDSSPRHSDSDADSADDESVLQGLRSDRLFFKPEETSSILEEAKIKGEKPNSNSSEMNLVIKGSVVLSMDSEDPYEDFKKSMQEMVEVHGLNDWESLEELLSWYLKVNGKKNHGFIIAAFVDLIVNLAVFVGLSSSATTSTTCCSSSRLSGSSPMSFCTSSDYSCSAPCISLQQHLDDDDIEIKLS